jgi:hypothetical protein
MQPRHPAPTSRNSVFVQLNENSIVSKFTVPLKMATENEIPEYEDLKAYTKSQPT